MNLAIFLIVLNLFKVLVSRYFPLIGDESFYWLWSRHLALSYDSHPPLIAYVNFFLTSLFGPSELAIRLTAIGIVLLISLFIYLAGRELFDRRAAVIATVVFNLLPTFWAGGMFLVPQTIFFLFWALSFYLLVLITKHKKANLWYLLGIVAGLGLLSDHVMWLFLLGTFLCLCLVKEQRSWLTKKEPYLAFLIALIVYLPVIIWNFQNNFMPFHFWGGSVVPMSADHLINFFGLQMLLYTPPIFIMAIYLICRRPVSAPLLSIFSAVVFLPFLLISPLINIGGHWTAAAYFPAVLAAGRAKKWLLGLIVFFAVLINSLGFIYYIFLYPTPPGLKGKEFTINRRLPEFLKEAAPKNGRTFYFANNMGIMGLISFHGKVNAYMAKGRMWQVDQWSQPDLKTGDNVIYFALNETELYDKLKPLWRKVSIDPEPRLFAKDADIPTKTEVFHCAGFKGGTIP
jgi:4-amino-4-deoxy-L-arabinose transferase-like glycosyltransferase